MKERFLSFTIYGLTTGIGLAAFLYPFWSLSLSQTTISQQAHADDSPFMLTFLVGICFVVLLFETQGQAVNSKFIALLGILVSINSILRFAEIAIPGPGGFSPIFFLIILTGYIFGGRFGFLMGALTLLVSALITGAVGPWLPYQMFAAGWAGMSAPLCRPTVWLINGQSKWTEVAILAALGAFWGLMYGIIINIWFWPFVSGPVEQYWQPGISLFETIKRYATFYVATSLIWDVLRSIGNVVITVAFGMPVLRALRRFQQRFDFSYQPALKNV